MHFFIFILEHLSTYGALERQRVEQALEHAVDTFALVHLVAGGTLGFLLAASINTVLTEQFVTFNAFLGIGDDHETNWTAEMIVDRAFCNVIRCQGDRDWYGLRQCF